MSKKLNSWIKIETLSYLKVVSFGFFFSILFANCNSRDSNVKVEEKDSVKSSETFPDPGPKINWLGHWRDIPFTADSADERKIDSIKRNIRVYVRGWLAEYNDEDRPNRSYIVDEFIFDRKSSSPLRYTIKAFLNPAARTSGDGPGAHLIPPPPPPPSGT